MTGDSVLFERADGVAVLTLNRPSAKNAIDIPTTDALVAALRGLRAADDIRAVVLAGAGGDFCAGGDVKGMADGASRTVEQRRAGMARYAELARALASLDKPLIAAVDGVAFGAGLSMALYADIVLVSTRARLAMVFHRIGLVPDVGAWYQLPRVVGLQRAKELIYSAREFGADEAVRMNIALEALAPEALMPRAMELARSLAGASPTAFSLSSARWPRPCRAIWRRCWTWKRHRRRLPCPVRTSAKRSAASLPRSRRSSAGRTRIESMIDYEKTKAWRSDPVRHTYTERDTILYALGVGFAADPLVLEELRFVYEKELQAVPTMAAVLASPGFWMRDRKELGIDYLKLVHGEQGVTIHSPLPAAGTLIGQSRVTRIVDKGEGKGATMHVEKTLTDEASGRPVATAEMVLFLRGDGGFSKNGGGDEPVPAAPATPDAAPEVTIEMPTRADAAVLYRLSGDINPLHIDPAVAAKAGFPRPILHGLATYGNACRGILAKFCGHDASRMKSIRARLTSPVYPGETLVLDCWRLGSEEIAFRASVKERGVQVLANGRAVLGAR